MTQRYIQYTPALTFCQSEVNRPGFLSRRHAELYTQVAALEVGESREEEPRPPTGELVGSCSVVAPPGCVSRQMNRSASARLPPRPRPRPARP
jgi:hypothetical protein